MAKEIFLINRGDALIPNSEDAEEALRSYPFGVQLRVKVTQTRSLPHHRFYWAFLAHVFPHWPEHHKHPLRDEDHLHAWLAVYVDWCEEFTSELMPDLKTAGLAATMVIAFVKKISGDKPFWLRIDGNKVTARWPKSIAFSRMDEEEFKRFTTRVFTAIYEKVGIDIDEYYEKWQDSHGALKVVPERNKSPVEQGLYFS